MLQRFAVTITLLLLALAGWGHAQLVEIPDSNLRSYVAESLGVNPNRITRVDMRRLERIDAVYKEIESLEGLQHAPNLRLLDLDGNRISDLTPLANLTNLEELGLDRNQVSDISPLAGLINLQVLTIDENRISDLTPLASLRNLEALVMDRNDITDISPLGRLTNLRILKMFYNGISDLTPLADLTNLEELLLNENRISDVEPLRGLTNLRTLKIEGNFIVDYSPLDGLSIAHFTYDQVVHFPDPNLRAVIVEASGANPDRITRVALRRLERLDAVNREIESLEGLQHAPNLRLLDLAGNRISGLTPLANLHSLEELGLDGNAIKDMSPLVGLTNLRVLTINQNLITDIEPLRGLTGLRVLTIEDNFIVDHFPLDGLSLDVFVYDQTCDMPPFELESRLKNRTFPSVFAAWGGLYESPVLNQPHLSAIESISQHDLHFSGPMFGHRFFDTGETWELRGVPGGEQVRDEFIALNPNMIFLVEIRNKNAYLGSVPEDSPYWLKDANSKLVSDFPGAYEVDVTHPVTQEIIINQALAVARCGLYDGIMFDHWGDSENPDARGRALRVIIERIRAETRPDFLIMGNTNDNKIPKAAEHTNGGFMETGVPENLTGESLESGLVRIEDALLWLESNLKEPQINGLEGFGIPTEPPDSPTNLRWMRAITTMSLTHSDGYVMFNDGVGHSHFWYDFWDADLGRTLSEAKAQLYENREGLYIREFANGWAVYNHSGAPQVITLPEEVQGVASGLVNTEHELPNLDGEMYLRVKLVNPADVNGDGIVNVLDLVLVAQGLGTNETEVDVNGDGVVNVFDLVFVANQF